MNPRNIAVTLECFIRKDGKYLLLHRNKDKKILPNVWMAPGGKREFNEGLFEATRREVREETGLEIKNLKVKAVGNAHMQDIDQEIFFTFVFAEYASGEIKTDTSVDGELQWFSVEEMLKLDTLLAELKIVSKYIFNEDDSIVSYKAVYGKGNELLSIEIEKP